MPIIVLLLGLLTSILTYSGFGNSIHFNEICLIFSWLCGGYYFLTREEGVLLKMGPLSLPISISCVVLLVIVLLNWKSYNQLLNFTTLFGLVIGTNLLSRIRWSESNPFTLGIVLWVFSWLVIQLFLPGRTLSGWNTNSAIGILPWVMCALSFIYFSDNSRSVQVFYICLLLTIAVTFTLENRSSLLSLILFGAIAFPKVYKVIDNRKWFRIIYLSLLIFNVATPLFNDVIGNSDLYKEIMSASQSYVNKAGGFNARDILWNKALAILETSPILGHGGMRTIYFHNFSCDVLTQFGWLGWITFAGMFSIIMEKCFNPGSKANLFLYSVACLLLLNTFENAFLANHTFVISQICVFGISWQLKNISQNSETQE